jgi:hypothetical protein
MMSPRVVVGDDAAVVGSHCDVPLFHASVCPEVGAVVAILRPRSQPASDSSVAVVPGV